MQDITHYHGPTHCEDTNRDLDPTIDRDLDPTTDQAIVRRDGARLFTTSRDIARCFGKQHSHVLRDIDNLGCSPEFNQSNFGCVEYLDKKGERRRAVEITRDGFAILAMGFTGRRAMAWKERYIAAFNALAEVAPRPGAAEFERLREELLTLQGEKLVEKAQEHRRLRERLRRAEWALDGDMREPEFQAVKGLRDAGLTWVAIAREHSYRSAEALREQCKRYVHRFLAEDA